MNKNLRQTLAYFIGTVAAYCTFVGLLLQFTSEISWVINYTLLLTIMAWMMYLQFSVRDMHVEMKQIRKEVNSGQQ